MFIEEDLRPEQPEPDDPSMFPDLGDPTEEMGSNNMPGDMGMDADMGPLDQGVDMPPDMNVDPCADPCVPGRTVCAGSLVRFCDFDANLGCNVYGAPQQCDPGLACQMDSCREVVNCVDGDGDGFGPGCMLGADCDDTDRNVNPNAQEVCDGEDNNCSGQIDEGLPGTGGTCTVGVGLCESTGINICDSRGNIVCSATPRQPSMEICNNLDDDCDMMVDEEDVCTMMPTCGDDNNEPNETIATAKLLQDNQRTFGLICTTDKDFYKLPTQNNRVYRAQIAYLDPVSDMSLALYENGVQIDPSLQTNGDVFDLNGWKYVQWQAKPNRDYAVEVKLLGMRENFYYFGGFYQLPCVQEDAFYPNDTVAKAPLLPIDWRAKAYMCPDTDDFYDLGTFAAGDIIHNDMWLNQGYDLDLFLLSDTDNDGTLEIVDDSLGVGQLEHIQYTVITPGRYYTLVRGDASFDSGRYDIFWEKL